MRAQNLFVALSVSAAVGRACGLRNVVYYDDYQAFATQLKIDTVTQAFSHIILSFAHPEIFLNGTSDNQTPFKTPAALRKEHKFADNAQFGLAIGGWVWLDGFAEAADMKNRKRFAENVNKYLDKHGFDFVDIDWEYPGATRLGKQQQDLKKEMQDFPLFLQTLNETLKDKYVTVAVGGKLGDDSTAAFNTTEDKNRATDIADNVAFFNIMAYDLTNRADTETGHHTSVTDSLAAVDQYIKWGYPAAQLNLGFALYAKHFRTKTGASCDAAKGGVGCAIEEAQKSDGTDTYTSGWLTFEWKNMMDPRTVRDGTASEIGACGLDIANQSKSSCGASNCCSKEGFCGTTDLYCGAGCQPAFSGSSCSEDLDLHKSFVQATAAPLVNQTLGAVSYWNSTERVFWTWETPAMITRKFNDIVKPKSLGGVFAWNLGQDTFDWSHLALIKDQVAIVAKAPSSAAAQVNIQTAPIAAPATVQTSYTAPAT